MKAVYEPQSSGSLPLLNADGPQLLIEKKQILERWAEHFDSVPNCPASVNDKVIAHLPQVEPLNWTTSPLKRSKRGCQAALLWQSSWIRRYPCSSIQGMIQKLTQLFQSIWREEKVPQQFKDVSIVQIYKRKGNRQSCDNHRGISLLCIAGNILARVLLNRLLHHLEQGHIPESQCGFHAERGISYMIFPARQLWEKTPGATLRPLHDLCRSDKGFRHGQQGRFVEDHGEVWLPQQVHHACPSVPRWHDCEGTGRRRRVECLTSDKRLRPRPHPLQHDVLGYAD